LPPTSQLFALLSADELRHRHGVFDPQFESVKHSSYEHPPGPTRPSQGKQRPFAPAVHSESDEQVVAMSDGHTVPAGPMQWGYGWPGGAGPRCVGQQAGAARWLRGTSASPTGAVPASTKVGSQGIGAVAPDEPLPVALVPEPTVVPALVIVPALPPISHSLRGGKRDHIALEGRIGLQDLRGVDAN
jgi:hypothetical protein